MAIRIFLADDHTLVREGIRALLERKGMQVVGEAEDGQAAVEKIAALAPDIAVLDVAMPVLNGIEAAQSLQRSSPNVKTIILTRHEDDQYVTAALRARVSGYVLKTQAATDLLQAIQHVMEGRRYLSPGVSNAVVEAFVSHGGLPPEPLSSRERQVLQLIAEGKSTKDVASLLGISVKTAESHRSRLMQKLDIHETATLVRYAVRKGLVEP